MQLKREMKRSTPLLTRGFGALAAVAVLVCLATGACVPPAPQPAAPPPAPPPAPAPAPPAPPPAVTQAPTPSSENWMDAAQTPGDWRYRSAGATTRASFGEASGPPLFEMVCERGQVLLLRQGTGGAAMRILAETTERSLPATAREGATAAQLGARDPLLDAIAFSKGRFGVEVAGLPPLYLPAWPEVTRVVEDCR